MLYVSLKLVNFQFMQICIDEFFSFCIVLYACVSLFISSLYIIFILVATEVQLCTMFEDNIEVYPH